MSGAALSHLIGVLYACNSSLCMQMHVIGTLMSRVSTQLFRHR